jgi:hypothetical protein
MKTQENLNLADTRPSLDDLRARIRRARELYLTALEEVQSAYEELHDRGARFGELQDVDQLVETMDAVKVDDFDRAVRAVGRQGVREAEPALPPLVPESAVLR